MQLIEAKFNAQAASIASMKAMPGHIMKQLALLATPLAVLQVATNGSFKFGSTEKFHFPPPVSMPQPPLHVPPLAVVTACTSRFLLLFSFSAFRSDCRGCSLLYVCVFGRAPSASAIFSSALWQTVHAHGFLSDFFPASSCVSCSSDVSTPLPLPLVSAPAKSFTRGRILQA